MQGPLSPCSGGVSPPPQLLPFPCRRRGEPRVRSLDTRRRWLERFESLAVSRTVLLEAGLTKDVVDYILWHTDLTSCVFHRESQTLRNQRLMILARFDRRLEFANLRECILHETALLKFEPGTAGVFHYGRRARRSHPDLDGEDCHHVGLWVRVRNSLRRDGGLPFHTVVPGLEHPRPLPRGLLQ